MTRKPTGQVHYFKSGTDGTLQPYAVCATDTGAEPKPVIIEVSPGASAGNLPGMVKGAEYIAGVAAQAGMSCVVLRPTGRGPGSLYQNYGEVDLFEALEHARGLYAIDADRISVTGASMGGAATWYFVSHYPDLFSAGAPFCGYCDHRLWEKPGGLTFHMHPWEEPSWCSRKAAFLVENLRHTPVWMVHGEWDRAVGGGVPVAHSRAMDRLLTEHGLEHRFTPVPETGHGCRREDIWHEVIIWLLSQTKRRDPRHVSLATFSLRHHRSYWVGIDQLARYGPRGTLDASVGDDGTVGVATDNVRAFTLDSLHDVTSVTVDGQALALPGGGRAGFLRRDDGSWCAGVGPAAKEKHHGASGPVGDMFHDPIVLVPGTCGSAEETFFNNWVANNARGFFNSRNGGVHRGGIMGQNSVDLPLCPDAELPEEWLSDRNLLLYGTPETNQVLKRFADRLPVAFEGDTVRLDDLTFTGERAAALAVFAHPYNPQRYVAVHGGVTPDAITWGSHLDMMLLPDYIAYSGGELLDWGFRDNEWHAQK